MKTQAIIVREVEREVHDAREERTAGVGQTPDATYDQINGVLMQILGYFDQIVQQNPQDLTAPRMVNLTTQLWQLVQQYNNEMAAELQIASNKLAACQSTSAQASTQLQRTQAAASSSISPSGAAAIAVGSALGGGILGYLVRAKMKA